jgi:RNA polymerase sigma factor for flagellar operon FliA
MNRFSTLEQSTSELNIAQLWDAYGVSRDETVRNRILLHYLPLSRTIARHMHNKMPAAIELDDLAQAAILGMRAAIATYDPSRGIPFENYCGPRVRGAILDHLRSLDWTPRMLRSRVQRMQEMIRQMEASTGTLPTDEELSTALNMPLNDLQELRGEMVAPPVRIRSTQDEDCDRGVNLEMMPDLSGESPVRDAQRTDLKEFLTRGLSGTERQILMLYYYENLSLREIGETLSLCESRVSQIHLAVIKRLRERMHRIGGPTLDE